MSYTLEEALKRKSNNLQIIKFLAALSVIVAHAFALTGNAQKEWLSVITRGQMDFGMLAVSIFFLTGGVLIAKSMDRAKSFQKYIKMRCIRIFPLLMIVVVITILLGVLLTELSPADYFMNVKTWRYLLNGVFILQHSLPGVFEHNIFGNTVNGSLWTLPVEFLCYIACYLIYKWKLMNRKIYFVIILFLFFAAFGTHYLLLLNQPLLISAIQPCWLFLVGIFFYTKRDKIILDYRLFLLSLFLMGGSFALSLTYLAIWLFLPYVIIYLAFMEKQCGMGIARLGDLSYAVYLCAFPIQQIFVEYFAENGPIFNMLVSAGAATIVGLLLFHVGEKPVTNFLMLKTL